MYVAGSSVYLTLIDWNRGKQYVLWSMRDCRCCPRRSSGRHRQSRVHKTYCFPEVSVNKYFIIYQESKKRKNRANFVRKYMKYFINFLKNIKFNSVQNVIHKTFAVFGCPKVACSRDGARDFFVIHRWIMHYLPRALMRGRQSNFVNLTWYALHQWNKWKGELWRLVYNKYTYIHTYRYMANPRACMKTVFFLPISISKFRKTLRILKRLQTN